MDRMDSYIPRPSLFPLGDAGTESTPSPSGPGAPNTGPRTVNLINQYNAQEPLFFEPELAEVETKEWGDPPQAAELTEVLRQRNLLLLAGPDLRDEKSMIARHLAWRLSKRLEKEDPAKEGKVCIREWYRRSDPQKIDAALDPNRVTILLLPQLESRQLDLGLPGFCKALTKKGHFAVITTDASRADWSLGDGGLDGALWQELTSQTFFGPAFLAGVLRRSMEASKKLLPKNLAPQGLADDQPFLGELSVSDAASRLKQPSYIRAFVKALKIAPSPISQELLSDLLEQLGGDQRALELWYRQLERKDQLLALALTLFNGLAEDQAFAAIEVLVKRSWREADPMLEFFDYRDLERLSAYIKLQNTGQDGRKIDVPHRREILEAAWRVQRRRLLAVLPPLTGLIKGLAIEMESDAHQNRPGEPASVGSQGSAAPQPSESGPLWRSTDASIRELYNTPRRQAQLQQAVIESLSQIGLLSLEATEPCFLELVMQGKLTMQRVVAQALAQWRGQGLDDPLWSLLRRWWSQGVQIGEGAKANGHSPRDLDSVRAAVALAVGYAAEHDPPNQLGAELHGLFERLLEDQNPRVRERFVRETLPRVVRRHPSKLEPLLRTKALFDDELLRITALSLALAHRELPEVVLAILESWHSAAHEQKPSWSGEVKERERLLAAVALTYGFLDCQADSSDMTFERVYHKLRSILADETHPFVRRNTLFATGFQAIYNFEQAGPLLQQLIGEVTLADRSQLVADFAEAYLNQREQMNGGDEPLEIEGRSYSVWLHSVRPLTAIENLLYIWLQDMERPVAQQVAVETFAAINSTALEGQERELIQRRQQEGWSGPWPTTSDVPIENLKKLHAPGPLGQMAVFLSAPRDKPVRILLTPLLAQIVAMRRTSGSPGISTPLLQRWQKVSRPGIPSLAERLGGALNAYRWRWVIVALALYLSYLLLGSGVPALYHWTLAPRTATNTSGSVNGGPTGD
jgi:hypothetical protein